MVAKKGWTPNRHPGPLLVAGSRRPNGAFYGDSVPFYARVEFPDPPPFANAATAGTAAETASETRRMADLRRPAFCVGARSPTP